MSHRYISIRVDPKLLERLTKLARKQGKSLQKFLMGYLLEIKEQEK